MLVRWLGLSLCLLGGTIQAATVSDDVGHAVSLAEPARRIVTLSPHATELAVAAGLERHLVAISSGGTPAPGLADLPRIGGAGVLDRETLLTLQPDLVIGWHSGNRPLDLDWIERQGIALFRSEPRKLSDIAAAIESLGRLGGTAGIAARRAQAFRDKLHNRCEDLPPVDAYISVWDRPAMSIGGRHWINAVLRASGFRNVFEHQPMAVFAVADEAHFVHRNRPIIRMTRSFDDSPEDRLADLLSLPGPRLGEAIHQLCARRLAIGPGAQQAD
jgi:iron complex transport system substrate-binding protein